MMDENRDAVDESMETAADILRMRRYLKTCPEGHEFVALPFIDEGGESRTTPCHVCEPPEMPRPVPLARTPEERSEAIWSVLRNQGVPWAYRSATLDSFEDDDDPDVIEAVSAWIEAYVDARGQFEGAVPWLYLYGVGSQPQGESAVPGTLGNGKTHIAIALTKHLSVRGFLRPSRFRFVTAESLSQEVLATGGDSDWSLLMRRYTDYELLVVDDLGVGGFRPYQIRTLHEVSRRRLGRATIWTSNLSLKTVSLINPDLRRLASTIVGERRQGKYVVPFRGPDRRLGRRAGNGQG
jgi:hypothetical protein